MTGERSNGLILAASHKDVVSLDKLVTTKVSFSELRSVWSLSAATTYAVGDAGAAYWKLGTLTWERLGTGTLADLRSVHGSALGTFAVGTRGTILKRL